MKQQLFEKTIVALSIFVFIIYVLAWIFGDIGSKMTPKPKTVNPIVSQTPDTKPAENLPTPIDASAPQDTTPTLPSASTTQINNQKSVQQPNQIED